MNIGIFVYYLLGLSEHDLKLLYKQSIYIRFIIWFKHILYILELKVFLVAYSVDCQTFTLKVTRFILMTVKMCFLLSKLNEIVT